MQQRTHRPTVEVNEKNHDCFHLGAGQNRKPPRQKQPFLAQIGPGRLRRRRFCHRHHQPPGRNVRPLKTTHLAELTPHAIADDRTAHPLRGDQSEAAWATGRFRRRAQTQKPPVNRAAFLAHIGKLPTQPDLCRVRKPKPIRLQCDGRSGFRHPSGGAACAPVADGGSKWRGRPWSSSAHGSRTAVCACACWVDRCVS